MTKLKFLRGLFEHEEALPFNYVVRQCANRFGSFGDGLQAIVDGLNDGVISMTPDGITVILVS